ncbi:MAG: DUF2845 domain-containing protein [Candidatus Zixiibacteriota bacterium]|nr:MAG: DUF2845 domain-containing protein [candidate division Zixibacteria bacterium]
MKTFCFGVLAALLIAGEPAIAETFRCGPWIASKDMTVGELLEKCGEPTQKTSDTIDVYGPAVAGGGRVKRGTSTIEKWTYDRGSQGAPMVVTIVDGSIKSMERGS